MSLLQNFASVSNKKRTRRRTDDIILDEPTINDGQNFVSNYSSHDDTLGVFDSSDRQTTSGSKDDLFSSGQSQPYYAYRKKSQAPEKPITLRESKPKRQDIFINASHRRFSIIPPPRTAEKPPVPVIQEESEVVVNETPEVKLDIQDALRSKLAIDLPLDNLNLARSKASISTSMANESITQLESQLEIIEKRSVEINRQMKEIDSKGQTLAHNGQALAVMLEETNQWMANLDFQRTGLLRSFINSALSLFSFLSMLLLLVWNSFRSPLAKEQKAAKKKDE